MSLKHPFVGELLGELNRLKCFDKREVIFHSSIDSTSTDLKRRLASGASPGTIVAAQCQTDGRGRQGRVWYSPPGGNLYVSLAVALNNPAGEFIPLLPLAAGVAALDAVSEVVSDTLRLKWPNDVLVSGKKLAGILCEVDKPDSPPVVAVVGLGVNIASEFPAELKETAIGLNDLPSPQGPQCQPPVALIAATWIVEVERLMHRAGQGGKKGIIQAWRERAEPFGRKVRVNEIEGVTVDLADDGCLIVLDGNGKRVTVAGGVVEHV